MKGLLFTYIMTFGGVAASAVTPFVGMLVYIAFSIIRPESMWPWSVPQGNYSRLVAYAVLGGWALRGFGSWRFGRAWGIAAALGSFLAWSVLSALHAPDPVLAWGFVETMAKIIVPFMVGLSLIDSVVRLKQLAWVILLCQAYAALEFNISFFGGYNRLREEGFGGMDNNCNAIALVACTGLALFLGFGTRSRWAKAVALGSSVLMLHAVLFSNSRGGMLGLILSGALAFGIIPKRPRHYAVAALIVLLSLRLAGNEVRERFAMTFASEVNRDDSAQSRLDLWAGCWDVMKKNPVLGAGPDHWPLLAKFEYGWGTTKEGHSLWLQTGAELGFPGLAFLAVFYGLTIARLLPIARGRSRTDDPWFLHGSRMVVCSLSGFCLSASFVSLEALEVPYYIVLIGAGLLKLSPPPGENA